MKFIVWISVGEKNEKRENFRDGKKREMIDQAIIMTKDMTMIEETIMIMTQDVIGFCTMFKK